MPHGTSRFIAKRLRDVAWGCGFTALLTPPVVYSLALDEITVRSRLGQPLDAAIAVSAAAGEVLQTSCFTVTEASESGLPAIEGVRLHLDRATGQLALRSIYPVLEPLTELTLRVRCDGSPALERSFLVVLDPPDVLAESVFARSSAATQQASGAAAAPEPFAPAASAEAAAALPIGSTPSAEPGPRRAPRPVAAIAPSEAIEPGSEYFVQIGDMLSSVAARVRGRPVGSVWAIAERIHAQNPMAFLGDDPDRLIAGVTVAIPPLDGDFTLPVARSARARALTPMGEQALLPTREMAALRPQRSFLMTTVLSPDSMEKLQLRRLGFMQAAEAATAHLAANKREPEPAALTPDQPVALPVSEDDDETQTDERAPNGDAAAAAHAVGGADRPSITASAEEPADALSTGWMLWALGALFAGALIGALLARLFLHRRYAAELHHAQSQRRGSGRERTIRLDHGIIVDEHHFAAPSRGDAPTQHAVPVLVEAPAPMAALATVELVMPLVAPKLDLIDLPTEASIDLTTKIASPTEALDLELPEMLELPTSPPAEADGVPSEVVAAAADDPLADSRQFAVDTDLLALAYVEDLQNAPPEHTIELLPMSEIDGSQAATRDEGKAANKEAYYHLEADSIDDTMLACERGDESKVIALWDLKDDEAEALAKATASRGRAANKG